ncbi:MAG: hypothetical protein ACREHV_14890 [Rhizomicrobium sp.]
MIIDRLRQLIDGMDPAKRAEAKASIQDRLKNAVDKEILDRLFSAVEAAIQAGLSDDEITKHVHMTLVRAQRAAARSERRRQAKAFKCRRA